MNNNVWNTIENQIQNLRILEQQIERVRNLLAEEWRCRTTGPESLTVSSDRLF